MASTFKSEAPRADRTERNAASGAITALLFDNRRGEEVRSWAEALEGLREDQVLWLDLANSGDDETREIVDALSLDESSLSRLKQAERQPGLEQRDGYLRLTAIAVSDKERDPTRERVVVDCFVGANWVLTAHDAGVAVLDDFRDIVSGEGEIGVLDAPSFLAALLEWVVTSYLRAFDEIEETLEEFDVNALAGPSANPEEQIKMLVEARQRVGRLRRSLAPHREVFSALSHSEFDPISSEGSAAKFTELASRVDAALTSAREAKDGIASSFDVLIVRTEHRTNEIMKVLTLASILLLPGALIAGVAGMNVNFGSGTFEDSTLFWAVLAAIVGIALATLGLARLRRWI
jgi:Mg2+ and Co2+ transporter CorA